MARKGSDITVVAKEGAEGLLGVGVSPGVEYPAGLGILIKLASLKRGGGSVLWLSGKRRRRFRGSFSFKSGNF